ncbi:MAG TPA: hypothetical protein VFZ23_06390 [Pyrinomonadaceae bacterium]
MNEIALTYREFYLYVILAGAVVGALLGLAPLLLGKRKNKARLGVYGFLASIVAGAIAPFLALIVTAIFSWLIIREKTVPRETGSDPDKGSSSDRAAD